MIHHLSKTGWCNKCRLCKQLPNLINELLSEISAVYIYKHCSFSLSSLSSLSNSLLFQSLSVYFRSTNDLQVSLMLFYLHSHEKFWSITVEKWSGNWGQNLWSWFNSQKGNTLSKYIYWSGKFEWCKIVCVLLYNHFDTACKLSVTIQMLFINSSFSKYFCNAHIQQLEKWSKILKSLPITSPHIFYFREPQNVLFCYIIDMDLWNYFCIFSSAHSQ